MNAEEPLTGTPLSGVPPWEDFDTVLRQAERARLANETERGHAFYTRAIELNPNDARGWAGLAATAPSLDETIISWAYALALKPDFFEARFELDAQIDAKLERSGIVDAAVLVALGRTLAEVGQRAFAYRLLQRATELDPTNEESWIWRAGVTENNAETISCLRQVLSMNPSNAQARAGLQWAEERASGLPPALPADVQRATQLIEQAQHALNTGQMEQAHTLLIAATEHDPQNAQAWFWRGSVTQDTNEALLCMEHAHTLNPQDLTVKDALWWLRVRKLRAGLQHTHPPITIAPEVDLFPTAPDTPQPGSRWVPIAAILIGLCLLALLAVFLFRAGLPTP